MEKLILSLPYVTFTLPVYSLSVGIMKRTNVQSSPNAATSSPMEMISFLESLKASPAKNHGNHVVMDFWSFSK